MRSLERIGWPAAAIVLAAFAIPWFLWGDDAVIAGLPLWLWWHVGWMVLASAVFWLFATRAWGIGIESEDDGGDPDRGRERGTGDPPGRAAGGGDRA